VTRYYVRADGDDSALGTSDATAWKSIAKVRSVLASSAVGQGDMVLFRSGDKFPGVIGGLPTKPVAATPLIIARYAPGDLPALDGSKVLNTAAGWVQDGPTVWKIDLSASGIAAGAFTGNVNTNSANTGFLEVDGVRFGAKKSSKAQLSTLWDFYDEGATGQYLYVYATARPTTLAADIRAAVSSTGITLTSSVRIAGLHLRNYGGHGLRGDGTAKDVGIYGCRIEGIGGAYLSNTTRFGNGIEAWIGSEDWDVRGCEIAEVYDTATTMQGPASLPSNLGWKNVHFRYNTIRNCTQAFEIWSTMPADVAGAAYGWVRCSFQHNVSENAGGGWGQKYRPDTEVATHLLTYSCETPVDVIVAHNTFRGSTGVYYFRNTGDYRPAPGYQMYDNRVLLKPGQKLHYQASYTIEQSAEWTAWLGQDSSSRFLVLPSALNGPDDVTALLAAEITNAQGRLALLTSAMERNQAERAVSDGAPSLSAQTFTLSPAVGFWEYHPDYGKLTATIIGDRLYLDGALRRAGGAASLQMAAGSYYAVASLPTGVVTTVLRKPSVALLPNGADSGRVPGFLYQLTSVTPALQVGSASAVTMLAGSGTIVFDGASFKIG
jgi:hypothetical protein